ncbi:energy transducer TonB [Shimia sp. SDUM112013]|uniref:energy transducer TonB n=1 Tax=Shimia sp. SDUM112013 TaxID=3136160 RepID=UPI0032EC3191
MHIGHYISGAAHLGLISWALFGGAFQSDPPPMEVTGVSMVSVEEFNAILNTERAPFPETDVDTPVAPDVSEDGPAMASEADTPVPTERPQETATTDPDATPDLSDLAAPQPAEVTDDAPTLTPPAEEMAVLIPRDVVRPTARPAPRVAPEPVAEPAPDTVIDDVVREATTPDDSAGQAVEEPQEATAPEAATTEIVTEAKEQPALAPKASMRPVLRPPSRPTPTSSGANVAAGADAAVAAALAEAETAAAPSGPPMTQGEKDSMRIAVQNCWVVDVGGQSSNVTVTVGFSLTREGKVDGPVRLLSSEGGDEASVNTAFQSARRAILRCQRGGYKLPIEKYDHWRDIEITFNPEKMRLK